MKLQNKVVIITGASSGIGYCTAKAFSECGAFVVLVARTKENLERVALEIGRNRALFIPIDITKSDQIELVAQQTISKFGSIDILVNNAGAGLYGSMEDIKIDDFRYILELNTIAPVMLIQQLIPFMRKAEEAKIINISSMITRIATRGSGGYRSSKLALNAVSDALHLDLTGSTIKVVTVFPGLTKTDFFRNSIGLQKSEFQKSSPQRGRSPEFVAKKIISAAEGNKREVYMSTAASIGGKFALLFPSLIEKLNRYRNKK